MNSEELNARVSIPMHELIEMCNACHGGLELDKFEDKNNSLSFVRNRLFGFLSSEAKADHNEWVDRKGWRIKEKIILTSSRES